MNPPLRALCALLLACAAIAAASPSRAAGTTFLSGTVLVAGKPESGVPVTIAGNDVVEHTRTDAQGRFSFGDLWPATYRVTATSPAGTSSMVVDLPATGADVALDVSPKQLAVVDVTAPTATAHKGGTDVTINRQLLTRSPAAGAFGSLLIQLPGAARGANGVVHINGDHGDINYIVDGVSIPQELNRNIGTEFNSNDVAFIDVLQGAYPAQYGERFASVLNIDTRTGEGTPGFTGGIDAGSFGTLDSTVGYGGRVGAATVTTAFRTSMTQRGLDPPNFSSPHNGASDANQFARYTLPHGNDALDVTLSHAFQTYQIPIDVLGGQPAASDDDEHQDDLFAALQERHALGNRGGLSYGVGFKRSHITDFGDPANDWAYGEALWQTAGGSPTDCAHALTINNYTNGTCAYSLFGDRTATDEKFNLDDAVQSGPHIVGWGGIFDAAQVAKRYSVTLQPGNFLALEHFGNASLPYDVVDDAPNIGHTEAVYLQDAWRMGASYELDYGVRGDSFEVRSTEFARGFGQVSPRVKLTRTFTPRSSIYAYYGRFFTPFSLENVSPSAAQILNQPLQRSVAAFDLKPQRDSDYELGGHMPAGQGDLGLRVMQKDAADLIDDTQVGVTLLHQDINYQLGRIATQSIYYQLPMLRGGRYYFTVNHTYSVNKGCETQLLAPCFGAPQDWTPADHEQRWGSTTGMVFNDSHGGWLSLDGEYGSGLSSAACPPGTPGFCKFSPHTVFDVERGISLSPETKLTMRVRNVLDDRYWITYLNAQGNHWDAPRSFDVGLQFGGQ